MMQRIFSIFNSKIINAVVAVFFISVILAIGIWYSYPSWDDAWLFMLVKEHGLEAIPGAMPDRPLAALLMQGAVVMGPAALIVVSISLWIILGVLSGQLLEILFPSLSGYKPLCIALSICPVSAKIHLVIYNAVPTALLAVVFGYAGFLLLHRYITSDIQKRFTLLLGLLFFIIGNLISEYVMPVAFISVVLFLPHIKNNKLKRKAFTAISFLLLTVAVIYPFIAFHARDNTSPIYVLRNLRGMIKKLPFSLFGTFWQTTFGAYTESLGSISQLSLSNKPGILCFTAGVCIAVPLVLTYRKSQNPKLSSVIIPLFALVAGILPVCLMSRISYPDLLTRFLLPLTPLSSVVFVFLLTKILNRRFWFLPAFIVGLICGSATTQLAIKGITEQQETINYSETLQPVITDSSKLVIAVIDSDMNDYTLAGKITKNWSRENETKFWAINKSRVLSEIGPRENCETQKFKRDIRSVQRSAPVDKVIMINKDGSMENYCIEKQ